MNLPDDKISYLLFLKLDDMKKIERDHELFYYVSNQKIHIVLKIVTEY